MGKKKKNKKGYSSKDIKNIKKAMKLIGKVKHIVAKSPNVSKISESVAILLDYGTIRDKVKDDKYVYIVSTADENGITKSMDISIMNSTTEQLGSMFVSNAFNSKNFKAALMASAEVSEIDISKLKKNANGGLEIPVPRKGTRSLNIKDSKNNLINNLEKFSKMSPDEMDKKLGTGDMSPQERMNKLKELLGDDDNNPT
jgi:intein/homing endonuclease